MEYRVIKIEEDLDFGCEEREEGTPVLAVVLLEDAEACQKTIRVPDKDLYAQDINEGDLVELQDHKIMKRKQDER